MRARLYSFAAAAALVLCTMPLPSRAGWGTDLGRAVVSSVARQTTRQLIQKGINKLISSDRPYQTARWTQPTVRDYFSSETMPPTAPPLVQRLPRTKPKPQSNKQVTKTAKGASKAPVKLTYPTDVVLVPPPEPIPVSVPSHYVPALLQIPAGGDGFVPPPPPAPSVWEDAGLQQPSSEAMPTASPPVHQH